MAQIVNFPQNSETVTVDNGTLQNSVVQTYSYTWYGSTSFIGSPVLYLPLIIRPSNTATSTVDYSSAQLVFYNSIWVSSVSAGFTDTTSITSATNSFTANAYVDGTLVASTTSSSTYSLPVGSHTLKITITDTEGSSSFSIYSSGTFVASTQDFGILTTTVVINGNTYYSAYAYINWETSSGSANFASQPIYLNTSNQLVLGAGAVVTKNNTLDDGSGNQTNTGGITAGGLITANAGIETGQQQSIIWQVANASGNVGNWNAVQFSNRFAMYPTSNSNLFTIENSGLENLFSVNPTTNGTYAYKNTLDDGSGNMSIIGALSLASKFIQATTPGATSVTHTQNFGADTVTAGQIMTFPNYVVGVWLNVNSLAPTLGGTVYMNASENSRVGLFSGDNMTITANSASGGEVYVVWWQSS